MNLNAANGVLVHELIHLLISVLIASFFWWRYKDLRLFFVVLIIGIFIDIDHWFDYFAWFGFKINLRNFFNVSSYVIPAGKIYVLLHGWEFVIPFWLIGRWMGKRFKIKNLEWAVALSYLGHLLWDNFSFSHHPLAYSFIYRLLNNFSLESFNGI
jgi:hypothetical protein